MKRYLFLIYLIFITIYCKSQDSKLTNFWIDKIGVNPALVGEDVTLDISLVHKTQWNSLANKYLTENFSLDSYRPVINGGFGWGVNIQNNIEGVGNFTTTKIEPAFSYWHIFGRYAELSGGFCPGIVLKKVQNNFQFSDQIDPVLGFVYESSIQWIDTNSLSKRSYFQPRIGTAFKVFLGNDRKSRTAPKESNYIKIGYSTDFPKSPPSYSFFERSSFLIPNNNCLQILLNLRLKRYGKDAYMYFQPYYINQYVKYNGSKSIFKSTTLGGRLFYNSLTSFLSYRFRNFNGIKNRDAISGGITYSKNLGTLKASNADAYLDYFFSVDVPVNGINNKNAVLAETGISFEVGVLFKIPTRFAVDNHRNNQGHRSFKPTCPGL